MTATIAPMLTRDAVEALRCPAWCTGTDCVRDTGQGTIGGLHILVVWEASNRYGRQLRVEVQCFAGISAAGEVEQPREYTVQLDLPLDDPLTLEESVELAGALGRARELAEVER